MHVVYCSEIDPALARRRFFAYTNGWKAYAPLQLRLQPDLPVFIVLKHATGQ